tara:strand:- start:659 stop:817 length:159 start_codon:yes stop_codon:yes gene_type:complete
MKLPEPMRFSTPLFALAGKVLLKTEPATSARHSFDSALESRSTTIRPGFGPW